ncbi:MAG: hypothetical protein WEF51_06970 [Chloroflexota bacterium]
MPMWRCPHCGTPQSETSRCWVCKRSSTSCGTCRHFRKSIAGHLGYCGLDPRRVPLSGDEIRGCWEAALVTDVAQAAAVRVDRAPRLDFVPVGPAPRARARRAARPRRGVAGRTPDPLLGFWGEEP